MPIVGDVDWGIALIDKGLMLNANLATAWSLSEFLRVGLASPTTLSVALHGKCALVPLIQKCSECWRGWRDHLLAGR